MHNKFKFITILCGLAFLFLFACKVADAGATADDSTDTKKWTVTVELNGGIGLEKSYTVDDGKTLGISNPTKTGYSFVGWATSASATTADFNINTPITVNTNIYALWNLLPLEQRIILTKDFATFHTFQYQVEIQAIDADTTLEFIASSDPTAPAYSNIQNDGAKKSAFFTPNLSKRGVYFNYKSGGTFIISDLKLLPVLTTVNGLYDPASKNYIDLKEKTTKAEVKTAIESVSQALMSPGATYYVHVYKDGHPIKSSEAVILPDYFTTTWTAPITKADYLANPTTAVDITKYVLGRDGYKNFASLDINNVPINATNNSTLEGNNAETILFPLSMVFPVESPSTSCSSSPSINYNSISNSKSIVLRGTSYPMLTDMGNYSNISFAPPTGFGTKFTFDSSADQYYVLDVLFPNYFDNVSAINNNGTQIYATFSRCSALSTVVNQIALNTLYNIKIYDK